MAMIALGYPQKAVVVQEFVLGGVSSIVLTKPCKVNLPSTQAIETPDYRTLHRRPWLPVFFHDALTKMCCMEAPTSLPMRALPQWPSELPK